MKNPNIITAAMSKFIVSSYIAYIPALAVCIAVTDGIYVPLWIHCLALIAVAAFLLSSLLVTVDEVGLFFGGKLRVAAADSGIQTITATSGCVKKIRQRVVKMHRRIIPVQISQVGAISPSLKAANTRAKGRTSSHSNRGAKKPTSSGDDSDDGGSDEDSGYKVTAIKLINTQSDLADLVGKSKKTIQNIASNSPNLLPPAVYLPTSRAPLYLGQDIITWFLNHRAIPAQKPKRIGRPRIAVQLGLTKKGVRK